MTKSKMLIVLAAAAAALAALAPTASANFFGMKSTNCKSTTLNVCGTNLTPVKFTVGESSVTCPAETALIERWTIQKADEKQEEVQEGGHLEIEFSCAKAVAELGGTKAAAEVNPGCAIQLEQTKGQTKEVRGKVTKACTLKAGAGLCTVTVPTTGNQGLGFTTLSDTEKGASLMELLLKAAITGVTTKASGLFCGFTESKEGKFAVEGQDIWDVLWT